MSRNPDTHQWSKLTGSRQTRMSWARVIESVEAIPEAYQESCGMLLDDSQAFPYMVFAPVIRPAMITVGSLFRTSEKLLCALDNTFYVLERAGDEIVTTAYPYQNICFLEMGKILLYSWLTVSGMTREGIAASSTIEFNTATVEYFEPFLAEMRPASTDAGEDQLQFEKDKFSDLESADFKFMNYARDSLVHGETVIHAVWQPKIRRQVLSLFGLPIYKTVSLAHLALLTDKEVIFIADDKRGSERRGVRHGGIWQYIPLRHIVSVSVAQRAGNLLTLSLTLSNSEQRPEKIFAASQKQEVAQFKNELEELLSQR